MRACIEPATYVFIHACVALRRAGPNQTSGVEPRPRSRRADSRRQSVACVPTARNTHVRKIYIITVVLRCCVSSDADSPTTVSQSITDRSPVHTTSQTDRRARILHKFNDTFVTSCVSPRLVLLLHFGRPPSRNRRARAAFILDRPASSPQPPTHSIIQLGACALQSSNRDSFFNSFVPLLPTRRDVRVAH